MRAALAAGEAAARGQVSIATQQLQQLKAEVSGLLTLNDSVLSVHDAVSALNDNLAAQQAQIAAGLQAMAAASADVAAAVASANENNARLNQQLDAAALTPPQVTATVTAAIAQPQAASAMADTVGQAVQDALGPALVKIAKSTDATTDLLDSVINGPLKLNTAA
ncbi:MAG: hypothetical protein JF588_11500 [Caulobacterales bacterium]|nr:hypothetical protein [Caulobacterales bacterium]